MFPQNSCQLIQLREILVLQVLIIHIDTKFAGRAKISTGGLLITGITMRMFLLVA